MGLRADQGRTVGEPCGVELEVCVGSLDDALVAKAAGADRLELCGALELGGLTPSIGLVDQVVGEIGLPVVVMIRPRIAGFSYSEGEFRCMRNDAVRLLDAGVDGIVFGVLGRDGTLDETRIREMVSIAAGRPTVFHRAFDSIERKQLAIESLARLGVSRLLSSGGAQTAGQGIAALRDLVKWSLGRIEIVAGGGVTPRDIDALLSGAGVRAIHAGGATRRFDPSTSPAESASLCDLETIRAGALRAADAAKIREIKQAIRSY